MLGAAAANMPHSGAVQGVGVAAGCPPYSWKQRPQFEWTEPRDMSDERQQDSERRTGRRIGKNEKESKGHAQNTYQHR